MELYKLFYSSEFLLCVIIDRMIGLALSDDVLAPKEENYIRQICKMWGIDGATYLSILKRREENRSALHFFGDFFYREEEAKGDFQDASFDSERIDGTKNETEVSKSYKMLGLNATNDLKEVKESFDRLLKNIIPTSFHLGVRSRTMQERGLERSKRPTM